MNWMRAVFFSDNNEWRTGWRMVAFVILIVALGAGLNFAWRALGLPRVRVDGVTQPFPLLALASLVAGGSLLIAAVLLRYFESQDLAAIGLWFKRRALTDTLYGTLLGAVPVALVVGFAVLAGFGEIGPGAVDIGALAISLLPMLAASYLLAAWEELTLRGYLLRQFSIAFNPTTAAIITGIVFGLMHSGNPGANWQGLLYTAVGGFLMGLLMIRTGSLWLLIGYHFGWNVTASGLFGLDVSGISEKTSLFTSTLSGSDWLTGGDYGFEAALPTAVFEILILLLVLRYYKKKT